MSQSPSEKAEALWYELQDLTLDELYWLREKINEQLEDEGGGAGVREPRRPIRPRSGGMISLEDDPSSTETQNFEFLTPEERTTA